MKLPENCTAVRIPSTVQVYKNESLLFEFPAPYDPADFQTTLDFFLKQYTETKMKKEVLNYMLRVIATCVDAATGEVNTTVLAELAADKFNLDSALDDETHWIWEITLKAVEIYG